MRSSFLLMLGMAVVAFSAYADPLPESANDIGYPNVAAARQALLARSDAQSHTESGWLIVEIPSEMTMWSFAPASDPSYPSAIKRRVVQGKDGVSIQMNVLCEASKQACDELARKFQQLTDQMKQNLSGHH